MKRGTPRMKAEARATRTAERREAEARRRAERNDLSGSRAAWRSAAESWRQCDRPVRAAKALAQALSGALPDAAGSALLAGVLQDSGHLQAARAAAEDAVGAATSAALRVLALDVLAGVLLTMGEADAARGHVEALGAVPLPAARVAAAFRMARLERLDGLLEQAVDRLNHVLAGLPVADRRFAAPRAAALQESAEYLLLAGDVAQARPALESARAVWSKSGRRPGAFAAEGLGVRLALAAGEPVLPATLDNGIAFAEARGLLLLGADLRLSRARARASLDLPGAAEDFDHAVGVAVSAGARLLEGRARLWRRVAGCPAEPGDVEKARLCLAVDRVLGRHPALWPRDRNSPQET